MSSNKKVFITGVAGFLGSNLAEFLLQKGFIVLGCDNLIGGCIDNVPNKVIFHQADCCDIEEMQLLTRDINVVFHAACFPHEGLSIFSPNLIIKNTIQATASVLSACISNNVERFVYCSSMARYGDSQGIPFTELTPCIPVDPYGIGKYSSELLVKNLCDLHQIEYTIAIPHNIIGPRQKYDDPYRNVISIMINLMLQNKQPIIYGDGSQKRCFSYIDDVIFCLDKLLFCKNLSGEIFNIGPDEELVSILDIAKMIAGKLDFKLDPIFLPPRPNEVKLATCSSNKVREIIGYETKTKLDFAIDEMIYYIRQSGPKPFNYYLPIEIENSLCPKSWKEKLF